MSSFFERYRQSFNRRGSDWWSIVFGYPVGRLLVVAIEPATWITPSALTLLGFAVKLAAAALLWMPAGSVIGAAIALQVAQVLDSMDGTLARARQDASLVGAFLDKITDAVGLFAIATALGWRAAHETGEAHLIPLGAAGGAAFIVICYMFWLVEAVRAQPPSAAAVAGGAPVPGWAAIGREWLRGWTRIVRFSEADLYFWIALGALLDLWAEVVYLVVATQGFTLLKRTVDHLRALSSPKP